MFKNGTPQTGELYDDTKMLYAIFDGGETKTGKGAAGDAIATALSEAGYTVYHDVAGDFYRRFVALVRIELGLGEDASLPDGEVLEKAAFAVYRSQKAYEQNEILGDLQRPSISNSVSVLGELEISQQAGREWLELSVERARKISADVLVLDGRNLRTRLSEQNTSVRANITTVLDLYLTCDPETAAKRTLLGRKIYDPTKKQIAAEQVKVEARRRQDMERTENPFKLPSVYAQFIPGQTSADEILQKSWEVHNGEELPISVMLDNSKITKPDMLRAVSELAVAAVRFKIAKEPAHS